MTIRKLLLSALLLGAFAAPALAEEGQTPPPGGPGGPGGHEKMMNADTDGDGFLSKTEFMAVHEKRFAEMDKDSDGKISKDEMKAHRETMREKFKEKKAEWEAKKDGVKDAVKDEAKPAQ